MPLTNRENFSNSGESLVDFMKVFSILVLEFAIFCGIAKTSMRAKNNEIGKG
jgi:hypothetical protein